MSKPITMDGIKKKQAERVFPPYVIEAFNHMIAEGIGVGGRSVRISQSAVVEEIIKCAMANHGIDLQRHTIFDDSLLDVEETYRAQGWDVEYDKGAYYEPDSFFYFKWKG